MQKSELSKCHTLPMRIARLTKSEAARLFGISRRSVIRYAQAGMISEDRRGRVLRSQLTKILSTPSSRGDRKRSPAQAYRLIDTPSGWISGYQIAKSKIECWEIRRILKSAVICGYISKGTRRQFVFRNIRARGAGFYQDHYRKKMLRLNYRLFRTHPPHTAD